MSAKKNKSIIWVSSEVKSYLKLYSVLEGCSSIDNGIKSLISKSEIPGYLELIEVANSLGIDVNEVMSYRGNLNRGVFSTS